MCCIEGAVSKALMTGPSPGSLEAEEWFHGQISRVQVSGVSFLSVLFLCK